MFVLLAGSRLAAAADATDGCGDNKVQFKVKSQKRPPANVATQGEQATVVFLEDKRGEFLTNPTVRYALDGTWVGANRGPSYFVVQASPGIHKVCAVRQSGVAGDREVQSRSGAFEAGKTYFYSFTVIRTELGGPELMASGGAPGNVPNYTVRDKPTVDSASFTLLEEAEGAAKVASLPWSMSSVQ